MSYELHQFQPATTAYFNFDSFAFNKLFFSDSILDLNKSLNHLDRRPVSLPTPHIISCTVLYSVNIAPWTNIYHFPSTLMCQWFVTEFLDINSEILAEMTGWSGPSSNHVFNHFLTPLLFSPNGWWEFFVQPAVRHVRSWNLIFLV